MANEKELPHNIAQDWQTASGRAEVQGITGKEVGAIMDEILSSITNVSNITEQVNRVLGGAIQLEDAQISKVFDRACELLLTKKRCG